MEGFCYCFQKLLLCGRVKLYNFIKHVQIVHSPYPSKGGGCTLKLSIKSSDFVKTLFCSSLRNTEECLNTHELCIPFGKPVTTSRKEAQ